MNQLDFARIQATCPYTIEEVANGIYLFETDNDVLTLDEFFAEQSRTQ